DELVQGPPYNGSTVNPPHTLCDRTVPFCTNGDSNPCDCTEGNTPKNTASWPNPQLIYYPATGSNSRLGVGLAVGNFNGDCVRWDYSTNPPTRESGPCTTLNT